MSILTLGFQSPKEILKSSFKILILLQLSATVFFIFSTLKIKPDMVNIWGRIAAWLFLISLLPGLITRFNIKGELSNVGKTIFFARTQIGISMFFAVFLHYILKLKSLIQTNNYPPKEIELYFVFGMLAMILSLVLAITSNQQSKKFLKQNWFRLHKLTYVILALSFAHVAVLDRSFYMVTFGSFAILEVVSFFFKKFFSGTKIKVSYD